MVYKWYILPIGGLYATYHPLQEPEKSIDRMGVFSIFQVTHRIPECYYQIGHPLRRNLRGGLSYHRGQRVWTGGPCEDVEKYKEMKVSNISIWVVVSNMF